MADVDHTHPYTGTTVGSLFRRGPTVAADGGRPARDSKDDPTPAEADAEEVDEETEHTMTDVSHTSPHGEGADRAFRRGVSTDE